MYTFVEIILSFLLIQVGQFSVTGKLMNTQGSHRLEKYFMNIEGFLEKSLNIKSALI